MPDIAIAAAISSIGSMAVGMMTQPDMPTPPVPEQPAMAAGVAEREANKRRQSASKYGRGSTLLSGSPLGIQKPANTSAKYLTGE